MPYEWDEAKRRGNIAKHGIDFDEIERFQWSGALKEPDDRHSEPPFRALGYIGRRLHTVVYTETRGEHAGHQHSQIQLEGGEPLCLLLSRGTSALRLRKTRR